MTDTPSARFLSGSTMRHVVVMTTTAMLGLTFMFIVDAVTLFWVSSLRVELFIAAIGFAWSIQFFAIGIAIAFMIGATALVSKSIGEEKWDQARRQGSAAMLITGALLGILAALTWGWRDVLLAQVGAKGEGLQVAADFLAISLPSIPILGILMVGSGILRAEGDGLRAMYGTLSTGVIAMIIDPILIVGLQWGVQGAAWGITISRIGSALLVFYFVAIQKGLLAPISWADIRRWFAPFMLVVVPSILTQLSTPMGNFIATNHIAQFGEGAIAGWIVINRILVVAFGGIFALSGAIGGIIGQNYGALAFDRVRMAYRDALIFSTIYVGIVWLALAFAAPLLVKIFVLSPDAAEVLVAFCYITAGSFIFGGALYVSNAAFNNLGRPIYSAAFSWIKDGVLLLPLIWLLVPLYGALGIIYATGLSLTVAGACAGVFGWIFIAKRQHSHQSAP